MYRYRVIVLENCTSQYDILVFKYTLFFSEMKKQNDSYFNENKKLNITKRNYKYPPAKL